MTELTNGSIFCPVIKTTSSTVSSLFQKKDISYFFIEASGLADPASMSHILEGISPNTKVPYDYRGSVCVLMRKLFLIITICCRLFINRLHMEEQ